MNDPAQLYLFHEIMDLKEDIGGGWPDLTTAIVISVVLIVAAHLLVWALYRHDPWTIDYMMLLASIISIGISVALVICAVTTQNAIEEYEMLCEMYRTTYGPLPWEVV